MMLVLVGIIVLQGGAGVLELLRQLRPRAAAVRPGSSSASPTSWSANLWLILLAWSSAAVVSVVSWSRQPGQRARLDQAAAAACRGSARRPGSSRRRRWRGRWRRCSAAASRWCRRSRSPARSMSNRYLASELDAVQPAGAGRPELRRRRCCARGVFPDVAVKMVEVGESTGALQEMLNSLAEFYDEEIETEVERFITLIEPVLLVVMGVVIAAVVLALYMPLFELSSVARADRHMATTADPANLAVQRPEDYSDEVARARKLAERYRLEFVDMDEFRINQELFRVDSGRPDAALRVRAVPPRRQRARHRRLRPDRPADDRRARRRAGHADQGDGRRALGDPVDPQEERKLAARARRRHRRLPAAGPQGRRDAATTA